MEFQRLVIKPVVDSVFCLSIYFVYMEVQVQKWGNSLALRIPKAFAVETNVTEGSSVEITTEDGNIVLKPIKKPRYSLDDLVGGITKENLHDETDWGKPVGNEVW